MRVTDPQAIKTIKHPSDPDTEFDISVAMTREKRMQYSQELQNLAPKEGEAFSQIKTQEFYDRIVKENLKGFRGLTDALGVDLRMNGTLPIEVLKQMKEVRLPDFDNIVLWLGQEIYKENVLSEEDKKKLNFVSNTDSTKNTAEG